MYSKARKVKI